MAEDVVSLYDFYWFQHLIFTHKPSPPPPPPHPLLQIQKSFKGSELSPVMSLSGEFLSFTSDSLSPNSVLQASELQRLFSEKEAGEGEGVDQDQMIGRGGGRGRGRRRRRGRRKSLSELESEEVKGFMDLGFVFCEEDKNSRLASIVPGLKRLGRKDDDDDEEEDGEKMKESGVSRPYLSEAWEVLERRRKEGDALLNWRIPPLGNEMDMKDNLRLWAHTVASAVR